MYFREFHLHKNFARTYFRKFSSIAKINSRDYSSRNLSSRKLIPIRYVYEYTNEHKEKERNGCTIVLLFITKFAVTIGRQQFFGLGGSILGPFKKDVTTKMRFFRPPLPLCHHLSQISQKQTHLYVHRRTHKHTHTQTNTHTQTHTQTNTHTHKQAHTQTHTHTNTHTNTHRQIDTHTYPHIHTQTHTHTHTQTHTNTHTHTHALAHTHTNTNTQTHTYTHTVS